MNSSVPEQFTSFHNFLNEEFQRLDFLFYDQTQKQERLLNYRLRTQAMRALTQQQQQQQRQQSLLLSGGDGSGGIAVHHPSNNSLNDFIDQRAQQRALEQLVLSSREQEVQHRSDDTGDQTDDRDDLPTMMNNAMMNMGHTLALLNDDDPIGMISQIERDIQEASLILNEQDVVVTESDLTSVYSLRMMVDGASLEDRDVDDIERDTGYTSDVSLINSLLVEAQHSNQKKRDYQNNDDGDDNGRDRLEKQANQNEQDAYGTRVGDDDDDDDDEKGRSKSVMDIETSETHDHDHNMNENNSNGNNTATGHEDAPQRSQFLENECEHNSNVVGANSGERSTSGVRNEPEVAVAGQEEMQHSVIEESLLNRPTAEQAEDKDGDSSLLLSSLMELHATSSEHTVHSSPDSNASSTTADTTPKSQTRTEKASMERRMKQLQTIEEDFFLNVPRPQTAEKQVLYYERKYLFLKRMYRQQLEELVKMEQQSRDLRTSLANARDDNATLKRQMVKMNKKRMEQEAQYEAKIAKLEARLTRGSHARVSSSSLLLRK